MKYYFILIIICLSFLSCEFSIKTNDNKTQKQNSKIRNGIEVKATAVNLEQAFLIREDGTLLPEDNKIEVKQKIKLRLITNGWKQKENRVYVEAAQKVIIDGEVIFDEGNLFSKDSIESLSAEDAKYINLTFWLDEINKLFDFVTVEFRVWDKMGEGEVKGSYKVYLK